MSRLTAAILVLGVLAGSIAPIAILADARGATTAAGRCCHELAGGCHDTTKSLGCCDEPKNQPAAPAQPQQSSPSPGASKKWGAPVAVLPIGLSPEIARVASHSFEGRQRLLLHAPPHLRLRVFQI